MLWWENSNVWVTDSTACEIPGHLDQKKKKKIHSESSRMFFSPETRLSFHFSHPNKKAYCTWYLDLQCDKTGRIFSQILSLSVYFFVLCAKYIENVSFIHKISWFVTGSPQAATLTQYGWMHVAAVWTHDPCVQVLSGCETQPKAWDGGKVKSYSLIFSAQHGVGNQRASQRLRRKREDRREGGRTGGREGGRVRLPLALFTGHFLSMGKVQNESLHDSR